MFDKGSYEAAYSGFEGHEHGGARLRDWLADRHVDSVDVVGIATDYCVRATALDAVAAGLHTRVLLGLCAGVSPDTTAAAVAEMAAAGVEIVPADDADRRCGAAVRALDTEGSGLPVLVD